jgi:hypothetical protein
LNEPYGSHTSVIVSACLSIVSFLSFFVTSAVGQVSTMASALLLPPAPRFRSSNPLIKHNRQRGILGLASPSAFLRLMVWSAAILSVGSARFACHMSSNGTALAMFRCEKESILADQRPLEGTDHVMKNMWRTPVCLTNVSRFVLICFI